MNLACWVERNGRRLCDRPALAAGPAVHATWAELAARVAG
ncbi:MAG: Acyl-CoA synthetase (AMP-forming)/AMP-acid ligase, partial [Nocardioides sp.]|nr:Acyl-CoA synthetase (AMP-forming)/AMP-acid ligase [Nocardioides sp.]